jgi:hypothetical protein
MLLYLAVEGIIKGGGGGVTLRLCFVYYHQVPEAIAP